MNEPSGADTALLELDDISEKMPEELRGRFYAVIFQSLEETGKFRLLSRGELPKVENHVAIEEPEVLMEAFAGLPEIQQAFLPRCEMMTCALTGRLSWRFLLTLYDLGTGKRLSLREAVLGQEEPPEELRWMVYEFADPERYKELALRHRLAGLTDQPELLKQDPEYQNMVLLAHLRRGSWEAALQDVDAILAREPGNVLGWHAKSVSLFHLSRFPEARQAVEHSITLHPNPEGWILMGDIDASIGQESKAVDSYKEAARLEGMNGTRGHAKLGSLEYFLGPGFDPMEALRMGWMWGYLHYVGVVLKSDLSEELQGHLQSIGSAIESQFRTMAGVHLARLIGLENWNAWVRALKARDAKAYRDTSEACFGSRESVKNVTDCLPAAVRRWLHMGRELFWIQAVFYVTAQHWESVGVDNPPSEEEAAFKVQSGLLAQDAGLEGAHPGLADLGRRMEVLAKEPASRRGLEDAVGLIEEFRKFIFEETGPKGTEGPEDA